MFDRLIKFGVVGCGDLAMRTYIPYLRQLRGKRVNFVATCDLVEERAKKGMKAGGAKEYYTDFDEMLEKADIEAVVIATNISTHAPLSIKAAKAGKHILTQKSMASNVEDAINMVKEVRKADVKCVVEPVPQLNPWVQKTKELIEKGVIGKVCWIMGYTGHGGAAHASWFYTKTGGGNVILDMGVYPISTIVSIIGPAKKVTGMAAISIPTRLIEVEPTGTGRFYWKEGVKTKRVKCDMEDNTFTLIDFGEGTIACIGANFCTFVNLPMTPFQGTTFAGSEGTIVLTWVGPWIYSAKKEYWDYGFPGWFLPYPGWGSGPGLDFRPSFPQRFNYMQASINHLIDCIVNDRDPIPNVEWGCHVTEIMVKSLESARTGRTLNLTTTF